MAVSGMTKRLASRDSEMLWTSSCILSVGGIWWWSLMMRMVVVAASRPCNWVHCFVEGLGLIETDPVPCHMGWL